MSKIPTTADVVVIGAGLGGLISALELARRGYAVTVVERHDKPGGYAHHFKRRGFTFDVSLHHIGGFDEGDMNHGILASNGIIEKLNLEPRRTLFTSCFPDEELILPNDTQQILKILGERFPQQRDQLVELFRFLRVLNYHTIAEWLDPGFDLPLPQRLSTIYRDKTLDDLFDLYIEDPRLRAILGQLWMYLGLPPSQSTATFSSCIVGGAFMGRSQHIVGGGSALAQALTGRLAELGGSCHLKSPVSRILVDDGRAVGVELASGDSIKAGIIISNANPRQTFFELLPGDEVSRIYRYRIENMASSLSIYATYLGIDCSPSEAGINSENFFFNHGWSHDEAYQRALDHDLDNTDWCLSSYEGLDEVLSPPGKGTISIAEVTQAGDWFTMDPATYAKRKADVKQRLLDKVLRRFPGLTGHIVVHEFGTPRTMAKYTKNHDGAVYGLAQTVEQSNSSRLRNRTPLKGLYLTGAWTWSGGGYEGAMMTGVQTAAAVLQDHTAPIEIERTKLINRPDEFPPLLMDFGSEEASEAPDGSFVVHAIAYGDDLAPVGAGRPAAYLRYMDRGRVEAIEALCEAAGEESWLSRFVINVYRIRSGPVRPVEPGVELRVLTGMEKTSSHRATFHQLVERCDTGEELMRAAVEVLFLGINKKLEPVPEEFPECGSVPVVDEADYLPPVRLNEDEYLEHRRSFRVYYEDTDAQGIAYHITYYRFAEQTLMQLLRPCWTPSTGALMEDSGARISGFDIRYLKAAVLGDRLEVRAGVRSPSPGRFIVDLRVVNEDKDIVTTDIMIGVEVEEGPISDTLSSLVRDH